MRRGDFDLVIAMGAWAGKDLANDEHRVPVLVCSTSNTITAGIIRSTDDFGFQCAIRTGIDAKMK